MTSPFAKRQINNEKGSLMPQLKHEQPTVSSPIAEAKIKPRMHPSFLLGNFTADNPPTGFSIVIHPDPRPADSVTTHVARTGTDDRYKLILHVTNNGARTIGVKIHQL